MSSDEDDYMSEKFVPQPDVGDIRPGVPKRKVEQRLHDMHKKRLKTIVPSRAVREQDQRETGLSTAISGENKGFQMLAKMGYKPGTSLGKTNTGIIEPIKVTVKNDKKGVAAKKKPEHKSVNMNVIEGDFRKALHEKTQYKQLRKYFMKSQTSCEYLDKGEDIAEPKEDYFWPKDVVDKLRDAAKKAQEVDDDSDDDDEAEEDEEENYYQKYVNMESLNNITGYLREKYYYCVYCAARGDDEEDLNSFCPGPELDEHSLD